MQPVPLTAGQMGGNPGKITLGFVLLCPALLVMPHITDTQSEVRKQAWGPTDAEHTVQSTGPDSGGKG